MGRRRQDFRGFHGHYEVVRLIKRQIAGAQRLVHSGKALPHIFLFGGARRGKTHLAEATGRAMGCKFYRLDGSCTVGELIAVLSKLQIGDVLFVDEAHKLGRQQQAILARVMSDGAYYISSGGDTAKQRKVAVANSMVIIATDSPDALASALVKRFSLQIKLNLYETEWLRDIVNELAASDGIRIKAQAARQIAEISRGLPGKAEHLLHNIHRHQDLAAEITTAHVHDYMAVAGIDEFGLEDQDREYLRLIARSRLGLDSIAAQMKVGKRYVVREIEDWVMHLQFAAIGGGGRRITVRGRWWLQNFSRPKSAKPSDASAEKREPDPGIEGEAQ